MIRSIRMKRAKRFRLDNQVYEKTVQEDDKANDNRMAKTLQLLHTASKVKIYKIADKIASSAIDITQELTEGHDVVVPEDKDWDFELGDRVRVKYLLPDFRTIQIKTLGWNKRLHGVRGHVSIVTRRKSKYDNTIQIYTPALFSTSYLYAGVLEKVSGHEDKPVTSQWKVGDFVKTNSDKRVVDLLQMQLDPIPDKYVGKKGRVIAVTHVCIIVTFDECTSYDVSSYVLLPCEDKTPIRVPEIKHEGGFRIGDRVQMTSNLKNFVKNHEMIGWNPNMTELCGQEVTVVGIRSDGILNLQLNHSQAWRVNPKSIVTEAGAEKDDIQFKPGDKVKIKMVENMRNILAMTDIPLVFLEYLSSVADVKLVDKDLDYLIRFNFDQKVSAFGSTLRRATDVEIEEYEKIQDKVKKLKIGDAVCLDVGPPNYVRAILSEVKTEATIVEALTSPSKLAGYTEENRAVIQYEDGRRYKVRKEFLTVPEKFGISVVERGIDFEAVMVIQELVVKSVSEIHSAAEIGSSLSGFDVKLFSMSSGTPPSVEFNILSSVVTWEGVYENIQKFSKAKIQVFCPGRQFLVSGLRSCLQPVKIGLIFNDREYEVDATTTESTTETFEEDPGTKATAVPVAHPVAEPVPPAADPNLPADGDINWMSLHDERLDQKVVYFPYKIGVQDAPHFDAPEEIRNNARNIIFNIENRDVVMNM